VTQFSPDPPVTVDPDSDLLHPWLTAARRVFGDHAPMDDAWFQARREMLVRDGDRLTAVMDGDVVAGTYRSWDVDLTLPGAGALRADAITAVTVQPTHRRRGVLTSLITADLAGAHERGTPVAILISSQAPIYGRYGFGTSTESVTWKVDVRSAALTPRAAALAAGMRVDHVSDAELREVAPAVYGRGRRPGDIDRWDILWDIVTGVRTGDPGNAKAGVSVVARDAAGVPQGTLRYTLEPHWDERTVGTIVHVGLLDTATPAAHAALWSYLVNLDLVATVRADDRAVDDPLPWLLTDRRAARQSARADFLWTRLLDVPGCLAARRYERPGDVVLEVHDEHGWAGGRFALEVADDGTAACGPTSAAADLELPVGVLAAAWLGGADLRGAAAAGLVDERREGAADRAAAILRTSTAPFSSTWF
jgi:predicted acetyltransferase